MKMNSQGYYHIQDLKIEDKAESYVPIKFQIMQVESDLAVGILNMHTKNKQ